MPALRRRKQYVNSCSTQEAEGENSWRLLRIEHGPEDVAAGPDKRNWNYIILFHHCALLPILFYDILSNSLQWVSSPYFTSLSMRMLRETLSQIVHLISRAVNRLFFSSPQDVELHHPMVAEAKAASDFYTLDQFFLVRSVRPRQIGSTSQLLDHLCLGNCHPCTPEASWILCALLHCPSSRFRGG